MPDGDDDHDIWCSCDHIHIPIRRGSQANCKEKQPAFRYSPADRIDILLSFSELPPAWQPEVRVTFSSIAQRRA
jgi:hypothetical protein